jgi:hypothetical protein
MMRLWSQTAAATADGVFPRCHIDSLLDGGWMQNNDLAA